MQTSSAPTAHEDDPIFLRDVKRLFVFRRHTGMKACVSRRDGLIGGPLDKRQMVSYMMMVSPCKDDVRDPVVRLRESLEP